VVDVASHARHDRFAVAAALVAALSLRPCAPARRAARSIAICCPSSRDPTRMDATRGRATFASDAATLRARSAVAWQRLLGASDRHETRHAAAFDRPDRVLVSLVWSSPTLTLGFGASAASGFGLVPGSVHRRLARVGDPVSRPYLSHAGGSQGGTDRPRPDPLVIVSGASLARGRQHARPAPHRLTPSGDAMMRNRARTEPVSPST
jgi:hypothetical protein